MVDTVGGGVGRVDVLERQLNTVIHVEATLRLTDQAQVGVVHQYVHVWQVELCAHRQLFDHELEVVVT